mmetsp:Transcript_41263/g.101815  ORF Transcript_41263/g.101815 Transcript_41263/m.101815 type:complete len:280 (-) Transcript_41263:1047-1886(-)
MPLNAVSASGSVTPAVMCAPPRAQNPAPNRESESRPDGKEAQLSRGEQQHDWKGDRIRVEASLSNVPVLNRWLSVLARQLRKGPLPNGKSSEVGNSCCCCCCFAPACCQPPPPNWGADVEAWIGEGHPPGERYPLGEENPLPTGYCPDPACPNCVMGSSGPCEADTGDQCGETDENARIGEGRQLPTAYCPGYCRNTACSPSPRLEPPKSPGELTGCSPGVTLRPKTPWSDSPTLPWSNSRRLSTEPRWISVPHVESPAETLLAKSAVESPSMLVVLSP